MKLSFTFFLFLWTTAHPLLFFKDRRNYTVAPQRFKSLGNHLWSWSPSSFYSLKRFLKRQPLFGEIGGAVTCLSSCLLLQLLNSPNYKENYRWLAVSLKIQELRLPAASFLLMVSWDPGQLSLFSSRTWVPETAASRFLSPHNSFVLWDLWGDGRGNRL